MAVPMYGRENLERIGFGEDRAGVILVVVFDV
jgi:hypothetical protein